MPKLRNFETMRWADIERQTYGSGKSSHHFVKVADMIREVSQRLEAMKLDDTERLFSLRLDGKKRIYGIMQGNVLHVIWYDPTHRLYPTYAQ